MDEKTELEDLKHRVWRIESGLGAMIGMLRIIDNDRTWTEKEQREKAKGGEQHDRKD